MKIMNFSILFFLLACSASDNVFNDGSPENGTEPIIITPPIEASPVKAPTDLVLNQFWFSGDFPVLAPMLTWNNPNSKFYTNLQMGLVDEKNHLIGGWTVLKKDISSHQLSIKKMEMCKGHRFILISKLGKSFAEPKFSENIFYDNLPPVGPNQVNLVDLSTENRSARLTWSSYDENCQLHSLESAISQTTDEKGIVVEGHWEKVEGNKVKREFSLNTLKSFSPYYILLKAIDLAGNVGLYSSEKWYPLGPLDPVTLRPGKIFPGRIFVEWDAPNNRNIGDKGKQLKTQIYFKFKKKDPWKIQSLDDPNLTFYGFRNIPKCEKIYVKVRTFNGLWSEFSKIIKLNVKGIPTAFEYQYINMTDFPQSLVESYKNGTTIYLNENFFDNLNQGEDEEFDSEFGDIVKSTKSTRIFAIGAQGRLVPWANQDDFITEKYLPQISVNSEIWLYGNEAQFLNIETGHSNKIHALAANKMMRVPVQNFLKIKSNKSFLLYLIEKNNTGDIIKERIVNE